MTTKTTTASVFAKTLEGSFVTITEAARGSQYIITVGTQDKEEDSLFLSEEELTALVQCAKDIMYGTKD